MRDDERKRSFGEEPDDEFEGFSSGEFESEEVEPFESEGQSPTPRR